MNLCKKSIQITVTVQISSRETIAHIKGGFFGNIRVKLSSVMNNIPDFDRAINRCGSELVVVQPMNTNDVTKAMGA